MYIAVLFAVQEISAYQSWPSIPKRIAGTILSVTSDFISSPLSPPSILYHHLHHGIQAYKHLTHFIVFYRFEFSLILQDNQKEITSQYRIKLTQLLIPCFNPCLYLVSPLSPLLSLFSLLASLVIQIQTFYIDS